MNRLSLEIVTPLGVRLHESGLDRVVLRRRESEHADGSLISIYPSHAPLLVQTPEFKITWDRAGAEGSMRVGPGVAEIYRDQITLLASYAEG